MHLARLKMIDETIERRRRLKQVSPTLPPSARAPLVDADGNVLDKAETTVTVVPTVPAQLAAEPAAAAGSEPARSARALPSAA